MSAPTDPLAVLRSATAELALARQRYELALAEFESAWRPYVTSHDALRGAIEAAVQAAAAAVSATFEEKLS